MAKQEFIIVKPDDFNPVTGQFTVTVQFLDDLIRQYITEIISKGKPVKINIKRQSDNILRTYEQLQKWWVTIESILRYYQVPITQETRDALHEQLKLSVFDAEYLEIGDRSVPLVPSLKTMELQTLANGIEKVVDEYHFVPEIAHGRKL